MNNLPDDPLIPSRFMRTFTRSIYMCIYIYNAYISRYMYIIYLTSVCSLVESITYAYNTHISRYISMRMLSHFLYSIQSPKWFSRYIYIYIYIYIYVCSSHMQVASEQLGLLQLHSSCAYTSTVTLILGVHYDVSVEIDLHRHSATL